MDDGVQTKQLEIDTFVDGRRLQQAAATSIRVSPCADGTIPPERVINVVFVGRSRSGKSTVVKMLCDPFAFPPPLSLFAQTREPFVMQCTLAVPQPQTEQEEERQSGEEEEEEDGDVTQQQQQRLPRQQCYELNVWDTPGLFETTADTGATKGNAHIKAAIAKALAQHGKPLHAVFFVCSFSAGIDAAELNAVLELQQFFQGGETLFHLLITRSEGKLPRRCATLANSIRAIPELAPFFVKSGLAGTNEGSQGPSVLFSGALDPDDRETGRLDSVRVKLNALLAQRETLLRHIVEKCTTPVDLNQLAGMRALVSPSESPDEADRRPSPKRKRESPKRVSSESSPAQAEKAAVVYRADPADPAAAPSTTPPATPQTTKQPPAKRRAATPDTQQANDATDTNDTDDTNDTTTTTGTTVRPKRIAKRRKNMLTE